MSEKTFSIDFSGNFIGVDGKETKENISSVLFKEFLSNSGGRQSIAKAILAAIQANTSVVTFQSHDDVLALVEFFKRLPVIKELQLADKCQEAAAECRVIAKKEADEKIANGLRLSIEAGLRAQGAE